MSQAIRFKKLGAATRARRMLLASSLMMAILGPSEYLLAAPLSPDVRAAVQTVKTGDGSHPRPPYYLLEQSVPQIAGDRQARQELASALLEAMISPEVTPTGRTILAQHLFVVAGERERVELRKLLSNPALAIDARIALGVEDAVAAKIEAAEVYLAEASGAKPAQRIAGLCMLVRYYPQVASAACVKALRDTAWPVSATAIQMLGKIDAAALIQELEGLSPDRQALGLEVLADHRVQEGRNLARQFISSADATIQRAAIALLGAAGEARDVTPLGELNAVEALATLPGPGVDEAIIQGASGGPAHLRITMIQAAAARGTPGLTSLLLLVSGETDIPVRNAALLALAQSGDVSTYPLLIERLKLTPSAPLENALKLMARRVADNSARTMPLLALLRDPSLSIETQGGALRCLGMLGKSDGIAAAHQRLTTSDEALRDIAVRALADWADETAIGELVSVVKGEFSLQQRVLAVRGFARLVAMQAKTAPAQAVKEVAEIWPALPRIDEKKAVLGVLGGIPLAESLPIAAGCLSDAALRDEAELACLKIISSIPQSPMVLDVIKQLTNSGNGEIRKKAQSIQTLVPVIRANKGAPKRVIIVTGLEYHNWRLTAPVLVEALAGDTRLEVSIIEDPAFLASPELAQYDAVVLHYQNQGAAPPPGALQNLHRLVEGGKGLVMVHFACGAFIDWPTKTVAAEFEKIAGRIWNPKLRAHDKRGPFQVRISDASHPIVRGLKDFETSDELYTCLDGKTPIQVLATATSNGDHHDYPMAFVLTPGSGRTFHCVLGHDPEALNEQVRRLYRRGTAWVANLEPKD